MKIEPTDHNEERISKNKGRNLEIIQMEEERGLRFFFNERTLTI